MPKNPPLPTPGLENAESAAPASALPIAPADAGLKPAEFDQYGMRANHNAAHGSDHGAASDHAGFDDEYRIREARDHRPRSIPTGLSDAPEQPATQPPGAPR